MNDEKVLSLGFRVQSFRRCFRTGHWRKRYFGTLTPNPLPSDGRGSGLVLGIFMVRNRLMRGSLTYYMSGGVLPDWSL
ncbi:MAG: hypothetical protein JWR19_3447 [Pedosphaera sp.]|nr:hypothetical protein [Pedosphaera sp.]